MRIIQSSFLATAAVFLNRAVPVHGEFKTFTGKLEATSSSVRYVTSFLIDPGSVDLTEVVFKADESSALSFVDDDRYEFEDDFGGDDLFGETVDPKDVDGDTGGDTGSDEGAVTKGNDAEMFMPSDTTIDEDTTTAEPKVDATDIDVDAITAEEMTGGGDDIFIPSETGDNLDDFGDGDALTTPTDGGDRTRHLSLKEFTLDLVFFHEPSKCAKTKEGCDWTELGIGRSDDKGNLRWCCSVDAVGLGLCESDNIGRLIINKGLFSGEHRHLLVPSTGEYMGTVPFPVMSSHAGSGQYTLVMSNCDDYGRDVELLGTSVWKSHGGYLPGDLFEEWHFIIFLCFCYAGLLIWYGASMKMNKDSTIEIQKWILGTIALSFVQVSLEVLDYSVWNNTGIRSDSILYSWIIIGVIKGAIARCLLIMVCLGWGVVRDTLGDQMRKILLLGIVYLVTAFLRDVAGIVFVEEIHILTDETEEAIYDIFTLFTLVTATIDVVCYMWILDALNGTMQYLENMNQAMKLKQYLRLRLILLMSILFGMFWTVLGIVNSTMETAILAENQDWVIPAAWSVNIFFILASIALLWRPNPRAKEFAYVMELPSNVGDDLDFESNVDGDHENGMKIDNAVPS